MLKNELLCKNDVPYGTSSGRRLNCPREPATLTSQRKLFQNKGATRAKLQS